MSDHDDQIHWLLAMPTAKLIDTYWEIESTDFYELNTGNGYVSFAGWYLKEYILNLLGQEDYDVSTLQERPQDE